MRGSLDEFPAKSARSGSSGYGPFVKPKHPEGSKSKFAHPHTPLLLSPFAAVPQQPTHAGVAQLVEQLICNHQVGGSSPFTGSSNFNNLPSKRWAMYVAGLIISILTVWETTLFVIVFRSKVPI